MGKIKELPDYERPREKAKRYGIDTLADHELLALILGNGTKGHSALDIAYQLLTESGGLQGLKEKDYQSFVRYKGISITNALKIAATFELVRRTHETFFLNKEEEKKIDSGFLYEKYRVSLENERVERLILIVLNYQKKVIYETTLFIGDETSMVAQTKIILSAILSQKGKFFYLIHNHPNGTKEHSEEDIVFIDQLSYEAKKMSLRLIDSIVVGQNGYTTYH